MDLYHVINRGVEGRQIFMNDQDRGRFVHDLYEFNDTAPAQEFARIDYGPRVGRTTSHTRKRLIDLHGWNLVDNHYHLLVSERVENGLTLFLRKLSGYARYFNERHGRRGALLQGRTKKVLISQHKHFLYILHYIHLNSLDNLAGAKNWRERDAGVIRNLSGALAHLEKDRWSSYRDYCGLSNFPSILTKSLFEGSAGEYVTELEAYLKEKTFLEIAPALLEYE